MIMMILMITMAMNTIVKTNEDLMKTGGSTLTGGMRGIRMIAGTGI